MEQFLPEDSDQSTLVNWSDNLQQQIQQQQQPIDDVELPIPDWLPRSGKWISPVGLKWN